MSNYDITDDQIEAFERDGAVTVDTPLTSQLLTDASRLMDRLLPLSADERNPPGVKPQRYRIGRSYPLEAPFVRIIEEPFFELLAKRLMRTDSVVMTSTSLKKTHPQPGAEFEIGEHTDMTLGLADLASTPRRMSLGLFIWISDVDEKCAPLMIRPGSHRQIAQAMGDKPRYIHGPWEKDNFANVPDVHALPVVIARLPDQWPDLEYAQLVACTARAGQVTALNPATIHGASTNVGKAHRKSLNIGVRPKSIEIGETKARNDATKTYLPRLRKVLSRDRRHIALETG